MVATHDKSTSAGAPGDWRSFRPLELPAILQHALDAFAEHGYHGTSVRDIARRIGVTVPTIYYHYDNKQDLLVNLLALGIDSAIDRVSAAHAEAGNSPADQFGSMVEAIVLFEAHRRDLAFLDSEIRSLEPENRARYVARRDELQQLFVDVLIAGRRAGIFATPHPVECSRAILAMCQGVATWYRPDGPMTPEQIAHQYTRFAQGAAEQVS